MARTANTTDKALEEFDKRARELLKHAKPDKRKGAKKTHRAEPKRKIKVHVLGKKARTGSVAERMPLPFAINALAMKNFGAISETTWQLVEALRPFLSEMTAEQLEKFRAILTPMQLEMLRGIWKKLVGRRDMKLPQPEDEKVHGKRNT